MSKPRDSKDSSEGRQNDMEFFLTGPPTPLTEKEIELLKYVKRIYDL